MKKISKRKLLTGFIYVAFVGGLLAGTRCETHVKLTTPERDAQKLEFMAKTIHSEIELRNLEKLAYEYEMAYKKSYNGAKALYFKSLTEPIITAAGDRRDAIRTEEDYLAEQQKLFSTTLENMDQAWRTKLGSDEEIAAKLEINEERCAKIEQEIATLLHEKQTYAENAWAGEGGQLDQSCLDKIGKVEKRIEAAEKNLARTKHNSHILLLAYRLQRGTTFVVPSTDKEYDTAEEILGEISE